MRHLFTLHTFARLGLAASIGLSACTNKEDAAPDEPCATTATVRLCNGYTGVCLTEHTSLVLANGLTLRPSGEVWAAYLPKQVNGQVLRISYTIIPRITNDAPGYENATLSCLEEQVLRCGNE